MAVARRSALPLPLGPYSAPSAAMPIAANYAGGPFRLDARLAGPSSPDYGTEHTPPCNCPSLTAAQLASVQRHAGAAVAVAAGQQHLDDSSDGWSDAHSDLSGTTESAEGAMAHEIRSMCISKLRELADAERLAPDFISEAQCDGDGGVSETGRQNLLIWLRHFNAFFGLAPDSFAVAASLVDSMLELTRVKPEHADLVGVACLRIAAKMVGAVELQPTPRELCINCDNTFSEQDLERMETIVYNKLQGQFHKVVPFDFLSELLQLAALSSGPPILATGAFEAVVSTRLLTSCFYYELMSYRPTTIALAVLVFELNRLAPEFDTAALADRIGAILFVPVWDLDNCVRCLAKVTALSGRHAEDGAASETEP